MDGSESHTVLPNLTPAVTYDVSVISVKGLEESEPALDSFTTGTVSESVLNVNRILSIHVCESLFCLLCIVSCKVWVNQKVFDSLMSPIRLPPFTGLYLDTASTVTE